MKRKVAAVWVSLFIMVSSIVILVEIAERVEAPTTLYVDDEPGSGPGNPAEDYTKIQDAINASNDGDTVFVYNGTYVENVVVNKTINLIGEDKDTTIIDAGGGGDVVRIINDLVNISDFTITNGKYGILISSDYNLIERNIVSTNENAIYVPSSVENTIRNNTIYDSSTGIYLPTTSHSNDIINNTVYDSGYGIILRQKSTNNNISHNTVYNNTQPGIHLFDCDDNIIFANTVYNNTYYGIELQRSSSNNLIDNVVYNTISYHGIYLQALAENNILINNTIFDNPNNGVTLSTSNSNTLLRNTIYNNSNYGISLWSSHYNNIYENNILLNKGSGILIHASNTNITNNNISENNNNGITMGILPSSFNNNVTNNDIIANNWSGIDMSYASDSNIENNNISNNNFNGIIHSGWFSSSNNNIVNNRITENNRSGINVTFATYLDIDNNNVSNNKNHGITIGFNGLPSSSRNNITNNYITKNNGNGIFLVSVLDNIINNNISGNDLNGIVLGGSITESSNNIVKYNEISYNKVNGIYIFGSFASNSKDNIITNNTISNNFYGFNLSSTASNNKIYHNKIKNNTVQAIDDPNYGNQWDNGYPSGGNYWSDYGGVDLFKGPKQDIPGSDGIGDTNYSIDSDSIDNYPLMVPLLILENYTILKQGWNLISIPFIQINQNLPKVLEMIDGYYDAVQWYDITDSSDPWEHNKIGKPFGNDLSELNETMSFWIHITQPGDTIFIYNGTQPTSKQTIQLHPGWNMVDYPSLSSHNRTVGLNNLTFDTHVDAIQWYDAASKTWHFMGPDDNFVPGRGYWVHSKVEAEWEVPL